MKTLGILGGTGPESTIDYYRLLLDEHARRCPGHGNPPLLINSVNFEEIMVFIRAGDWPNLAHWMAEKFQELKRAGADFGLIAANTPHMAFDLLEPIAPLPLVSIVEATGAVAKAAGYRKVGLIATRFTMEGGLYDAPFRKLGIEVVLPSDADREYVDRKYFGELFKGIFLDETREGLGNILRRLTADHGAEAVILGGTELPLILRKASGLPAPLLDTAKIHCSAAVDWMLRP